MNEALLLIDIQNDYFPGGKCVLKNTKTTFNKIQKLENEFHKVNKPVFYIQHISNGTTPFFFQNTTGADLYRELSPQKNDEIIVKHEPDSFYKTDLQAKLNSHNINKLIVCGWMTQMCLDTTVRSAYSKGYSINVISDACTTKDLALNGEIISANTVNKVFLSALNSKFSKVISTSEYLK